MAEIKSKTVVVEQSQMTLFTMFTNLEGLVASLPEDKRKDIKVDGDTISATYAGFTITFRISEKIPWSKISLQDVDAPFHFTLSVHMEPESLITRTKLYISVDAELNFMMRTMLAPKIKEGLDQIVSAIANGGILQ